MLPSPGEVERWRAKVSQNRDFVDHTVLLSVGVPTLGPIQGSWGSVTI